MLLSVSNFCCHISGCNNSTAVNIDSFICINSGIAACRTGSRIDTSSIDNQPAIRIDTVSFTGFSGHLNAHITVIHCKYRYIIFTGINSIITGLNLNVASVNCHMHFRTKSFIFSNNFKFPRT